MRTFATISAFSTLIAASPAQAIEKTYNFSGFLTQSYQFSAPIPEWQFAEGQRFTGKLVYDPAAVTISNNVIDTPDRQLTFHTSPIITLSFQIELAGGIYSYVVPTMNLQNSAGTYAAVSKAGDDPFTWAGVELRTANYPIGWVSNPPSVAVPASAYVGPYNPHSTYISLIDLAFLNPDAKTLVADTSAEQDLAQLFSRLKGSYPNFRVSFSDSTKWTGNVERLDADITGRFDTFVEATGVPESSTWTMMLTGFVLLGGALRQRKTELSCA